MKYSFENKVALVTGAASGMGLATAKAFAESGAKIVMSDLDEMKLESAARELRQKGYEILAIKTDISDELQVKEMIETTVQYYGRLDFAYNNAGVQSNVTNTADLSATEFDRIIGINLRGVWLCMKYELQQMRKQESGAIVNCSSLGGLVGLPGRSAYHASKHGVLGLTKSSALEYANRNIRINAICPGTIETPMVTNMLESGDLDQEAALSLLPIGRFGKDHEIADAVLWLCSDASSFVIGQSIAIDGGYTIM